MSIQPETAGFRSPFSRHDVVPRLDRDIGRLGPDRAVHLDIARSPVGRAENRVVEPHGLVVVEERGGAADGLRLDRELGRCAGVNRGGVEDRHG